MADGPLYHFSEEPAIRVFAPRAPLAHPEAEPLVWAVDAWHAPHYYFPRDCPRACFWAGPGSDPADARRLLGDVSRVIAVEEAWLERIRTATIYRYELPPETFALSDEVAGYYTTRSTLLPLRVEAMRDVPGALAKAGIELRVTRELVRLHLEVVASTLPFSGIRLRNADPALIL